jgi:arylsulfatase
LAVTEIPSKPNLVFVLPDRLRQDTSGAYGNDWIQSPHMDRMASESFVFEHCYVTQPVCAPARASIITGLYPPSAGMPRNRLVMPPEVESIAQMVSDDYKTGYIGKWHLGDEIIKQRGFDEWVSANDYWWPEYTNTDDQKKFSSYHENLVAEGYEPEQDHPGGKTFSMEQRSELPPEKQMASFLADSAAEFISSNKDNPFVLYVSTIEPHPPFAGPFDDMYDSATLPVDETFMQSPVESTLFNRTRAELFGDCVRDGISTATEAGMRQLRANYFGNVKLVDDMLGTILDAIDDAGVAGETIVVFTSEHGDMIGTHGMIEMRTPYEEAAQVPLFVRVPWLADGETRVPGNFSQIDFIPTLLDLLGQSIPDHLQGESRVGVLEGRDDLLSNDVVVQHNGVGDRDLAGECDSWAMSDEKLRELNFLNTMPWRSVITSDRWKLNLCAVDQGELYDLNSDPGEMHNLFDKPEHRDRVRRMAARLHLWQAENGDTAPLPAIL